LGSKIFSSPSLTIYSVFKERQQMKILTINNKNQSSRANFGVRMFQSGNRAVSGRILGEVVTNYSKHACEKPWILSVREQGDNNKVLFSWEGKTQFGIVTLRDKLVKFIDRAKHTKGNTVVFEPDTASLGELL
jgi:hypothetical protein